MQDYLSPEQINDFIVKGYVRIDNAFPVELAAEIRAQLWKETGLDPEDTSTWKQPVIRLGYYTQEPFVAAANTRILLNAFDQLIGVGRWLPVRAMGSMVLRFPSDQTPNDTGWHVDTSFAGDDANDFLQWRANLNSKGRALLMLFLFSDVGEQDAPTRIRVGSHVDIATLLQPFGEEGMTTLEISNKLNELPEREEVLATGKAGTVYLCHPFLVHAAQPHTGTVPRFMAQPPLFLKGNLNVAGNVDGYAPVELAIRKGMRF